MYENGRGVEQNIEDATRWYIGAALQEFDHAMHKLSDIANKKSASSLSYLAEHGSANAQFYLGFMYENGLGVQQNYNEACRLYRLAADKGFIAAIDQLHEQATQGSAVAQRHLYYMYKDGRGVERNSDKAITWYKKAAEGGDTDAQYNLGDIYRKGSGVERNYDEAIKWYKKAADNGYDIFSNIYSMAKAGNDSARKCLVKLAKDGNAEAQYNLGDMYREGLGVERDYGEAIKWYKKSADKRKSEAAIFGLGKIACEGSDAALSCVLQYAEQGSSCAQSQLGFIYRNGCDTIRNDNEAVRWYIQADANGNLMAKSCIFDIARAGNELARNFVIERARRGSMHEMLLLGDIYREGLGVEPDYNEAVEWYNKVADKGWHSKLCEMAIEGNALAQSYIIEKAGQGKIYAQNVLGDMYYYGNGVDQSYKEAFELYTKSAKQGDASALCSLGNMYYYGQHVDQDHEEAVRLYRLAANEMFEPAISRLHDMAAEENASAQYNLGCIYAFEPRVTKSYKDAIDWYTKAARQGHVEAQWYLGMMYEFGNGVNSNKEEAITWYKKAADNGHAMAQFNLGCMYEKGDHVNRDYKEAFKWYEQAANLGHVMAQRCLGGMYNVGRGVTQDINKAVEWYKKAAYQRDELAIYSLCHIAEKGNDSAISCLVKMAEAGNCKLQNQLGSMYKLGKGVKKDYKEAVKWYRLAAIRGDTLALRNIVELAESGDAYAQFYLSMMYEYGNGVNSNKEDALKWYKKAADQGHAQAKEAYERLKKQLEEQK